MKDDLLFARHRYEQIRSYPSRKLTCAYCKYRGYAMEVYRHRGHKTCGEIGFLLN